jgi:hypothetical protein
MSSPSSSSCASGRCSYTRQVNSPRAPWIVITRWLRVAFAGDGHRALPSIERARARPG